MLKFTMVLTNRDLHLFLMTLKGHFLLRKQKAYKLLTFKINYFFQVI